MFARVQDAIATLHQDLAWTVAGVARAVGLPSVKEASGVRTVDGMVRRALLQTGPFTQISVGFDRGGQPTTATLVLRAPLSAAAFRARYPVWEKEMEKDGVAVHVHDLINDNDEPPSQLVVTVRLPDDVLSVRLRRRAD